MSAINDFLDAVKAGNGLDYLKKDETSQILTKDDLRDIASELLYALESISNSPDTDDGIDSLIENAFDEIESNLRDCEDEEDIIPQNTIAEIVADQEEQSAIDKFRGLE